MQGAVYLHSYIKGAKNNVFFFCLQASQQAIDKLSRSNRGIKKAKEKMAEQFLTEIANKNLLIHKLEAREIFSRSVPLCRGCMKCVRVAGGET